MAHSPAMIAAPANATQVVNSEEPVIVFATESALRWSGLPGAYTSFRPRPATPRHKSRGSFVSVSRETIKRGHNVHAQSSPCPLGAACGFARACAFHERRRHDGRPSLMVRLHPRGGGDGALQRAFRA